MSISQKVIGGIGGGGQPPTHSLTATERQLVERCRRWQDEWAKGLLAIIDRLTAADAPCTTGATPTLLPSAMAGAFAEWCRDVQPAGKPEWLNGAGAAWAFLYPKLNEALRREHDSAAAGAADPARRQQTPPEVAQTVLTHCARHFDELAAMCDTAGESGPQRAPAFRVAAEECRTALTRGFGWMLDLQKELTGDAPPRPPQGRQPQPDSSTPVLTEAMRRLGVVDLRETLPVNSGCDAASRVPSMQAPAPTPAPTLTAAEEAALNRAIKQLNNLSCGTVIVLIRLRDRLLAAGAPDAAPTLTAEEREQVATVRESRAWELAHEDPESVVSQREYIEHTGQTLAIIDRCLLAAGAPTAASTAQGGRK